MSFTVKPSGVETSADACVSSGTGEEIKRLYGDLISLFDCASKQLFPLDKGNDST